MKGFSSNKNKSIFIRHFSIHGNKKCHESSSCPSIRVFVHFMCTKFRWILPLYPRISPFLFHSKIPPLCLADSILPMLMGSIFLAHQVFLFLLFFPQKRMMLFHCKTCHFGLHLNRNIFGCYRGINLRGSPPCQNHSRISTFCANLQH